MAEDKVAIDPASVGDEPTGEGTRSPRSKRVGRALVGVGVILAVLVASSSALFAYERVDAKESSADLSERVADLEAENEALRAELSGEGETLADVIGGLEDQIASHTHDEYALANHSHSEYALTFHLHPEYADASHSHDSGFTSYATIDCVNRAFDRLVFDLQYSSVLFAPRC